MYSSILYTLIDYFPITVRIYHQGISYLHVRVAERLEFMWGGGMKTIRSKDGGMKCIGKFQMISIYVVVEQ